jgi:hypothetical protein
MPRHNDKIALRAAQQMIKDKGYTQKEAAPLLGVWPQHLSMVLHGHRSSIRLLARIAALPPRPSAPVSETPTAG